MVSQNGVRVFVYMDHPLHRQSLKKLIQQQKDMDIVKVKTIRVEPDLWIALSRAFKKSPCDPRVVLVTSSPMGEDETEFRGLCKRLLMEFPDLILLTVDWAKHRVMKWRWEIDDEPFETYLPDRIIHAIRSATAREQCD